MAKTSKKKGKVSKAKTTNERKTKTKKTTSKRKTKTVVTIETMSPTRTRTKKTTRKRKPNTKKTTSSRAKTTRKRKPNTKKTTSPPKKSNEIKVSKALTDNFIALQKVMVNLSTKFDNLSNQISKLLELFEISAKSLARKDFEGDKENKDIKAVLEKLDNVSQQAGLIGKGLALIHEVGSEKEQPIMSPQRQPPIPARKPVSGMPGYQRSIASRDSEPRTPRPMTKEI